MWFGQRKFVPEGEDGLFPLSYSDLVDISALEAMGNVRV